ncbi:hypothetical protein Acr_02g0005820 [Actinidia rufa]|uniref:Transmembrane protein n=1 Tax=Actinidia rufa TaxID=165716 RepID=A0A7J0E7R5_9ERIC|nr:hypothetical protein Acr_02g0005820 [Actinidia rufa]
MVAGGLAEGYYLLTLPKEETNEESNEITNEMPKERTIDPVFDNNLMSIAVQQDLLLLENQLPFFVLEKLFHITGNTIAKKYLLASDLDYAGVKFVAGTEQDLVKVNFIYAQSCLRRYLHRAHFEIPPFSLYDSTELFLRNLIAFEQCCPRVSCYFTSYAFLMDMLVNSEKDVKVLQKADIIQNYLGVDQEASELFNKLCKEVVLEKFLFAETCEQVTKYNKLGWPKNVAHVRRKYFATPWTFIAFCVAFIAFGMSFTQFVRSFFHNSSPASLRECFVSRYQLRTGYCYVLNDDLHDQL